MPTADAKLLVNQPLYEHFLVEERRGGMILKEVLEVIKPTGIWTERWYEDGVDEGMERVLQKQAARKLGPDAPAVMSTSKCNVDITFCNA